MLCFHSLNLEKFHTTLGSKEDVDARKYPITTTITISTSLTLLPPFSTTPKTEDPRGEHHQQMHQGSPQEPQESSAYFSPTQHVAVVERRTCHLRASVQNKIWDQFGYQMLLFCEVEAPTLSISSTHYSSPSPLW